jgi:hypothetical protein
LTVTQVRARVRRLRSPTKAVIPPAWPQQASTSHASLVGAIIATVEGSDAGFIVTHRVRMQQQAIAAPASTSWLLRANIGSHVAVFNTADRATVLAARLGRGYLLPVACMPR